MAYSEMTDKVVVPKHVRPDSSQPTYSRPTSVTASTISDHISPTLTYSTTGALKSGTKDTTPLSDTPSTATAPVHSQYSRPSVANLLCFAALTLSIFLVALDTVLIPTALPTISRSFHIPDSLYAWIGSSYLLANAASVPIWGKLSDVFRRKSVLLISNSIFLGASLVCAVSVNAPMLVAGRTVQGLGGGGVVILVHVCVADLFSIRDRSFYLGIVGGFWALASALGPVLGGIFSDKLSWRWCFYINLPLVSLSIVLLYFTLHLHSPRISLFAGLRSLDWAGVVTILAATLLLLVGLQLGGESTYGHPLVICLIVFGALFYVIFPFTQHFSEKNGVNPVMPLRIFTDLSNLSALGVCACDALVFTSVAYFLPLYFQLILSLSPSAAGLYMLAIAIPLVLISFLTGYVIEKTGRFLEVLQLGLFLMTLGVGLLISFTATKDVAKIIGFLIIVGIGFGPNFHAPLIALQTRIEEADIAAGTATFGFVRMVAGSIGVVVGQVVFQILMRSHLSSFTTAGIDSSLAKRLAGGEAISEANTIAKLPDVQRNVVRQGMTSALRGTWIFYTVVSAVGLFVSFGIKRSQLKREGSEKTREVRIEDP